MYTKATQGSLLISDQSESWQLYAPTEWNGNYSLSTFIPNDEQKISKLLSCEFGRGSVVRDISDLSTSKFFRNLLSWKGDITVGIGSDIMTTSESLNTNANVIGYNGSISLQANNTKMLISKTVLSNTRSGFSFGNAGDTIYNIIEKYHPNYDGTGINSYQGAVSLLLKDGSWDIVHTFNPNFNVNISVSDFTLHHANKEYARTTDGYLRCRITKTELVPYHSAYNVISKYYALDYLPQVVVMAKSKVVNTTVGDYYSDVEIGYKNIEGTTRIVVSQYDDGEDVPFQFVLSDIKSGKFTATVDKEYPTTFVITSYNRNGSATSETYHLNALQPIANLELSFVYSNDCINVTSNSRRMNNKKVIGSYEITPLDILQQNIKKKISYSSINNNLVKSNTVNVSKLSKGIYMMNIIDVYGKRHSFKFVK